MPLTRMSSHIIGSIIFLCAACAPMAHAQSLRDTLRTVTVTREPVNREVRATAPTHELDAAKLLTGGVTDVADAIHRLPGTTLRDYGGAGGLKTVSVRGFGAAHTSVSYDGVPLSDIQSGAIDLSRYTLDNIDKLSLIIGDNEDIFIPARAAAAPASLQIATMMEADTAWALTAKMRVGSFGYANPFVRVSAPLSSRVECVAICDFIHADNNYPFTLVNGTLVTKEKRNNSRMNTGHGELNLRWLLPGGGTLDAKGYYYKNRRRLPGPVIYYNNVCHERLAEENAFGQLSYSQAISSHWLVKGVGKYNYASSLYHDEDGKYPGGVLNQNYYQREAYASGSLLWLPSQHWSADYSLDYFFNNLSSNLSSNNHPYRHSVLQSLTGKYRDRHFTVMARLLCSLYYNGAKVGTSAKNAHKLSPSLSASYRPWMSQNIYFRASYKQIFRMPSFNECYFDHYGSADVLPETTNQVNIGATYTAKSAEWLLELTLTVDGYLNHINDMIVCVPYNMFVWRVVNLSKVRSYGVDATLDATFRLGGCHRLILSGNYSYQRAQPRTNRESSEWNKQVAYTPKHSGAASLAWENPWVNVSAHATGVSDRYTTNNNLPATRFAGYVEAGFTAWRQFALPGRKTLELRADLINAFDKQYCVVARYPMPGRSWMVTACFRI